MRVEIRGWGSAARPLWIGMLVIVAASFSVTRASLAHAVPAHLVASIGSTFAAAGEPGGGGPSVSLSVMWPFESGFEFGVTTFADDVGNRIGRLLDPNDPSLDLGAVQDAQRWTFGGAWRFDASLARSGWTPFVSATWGYYRVRRDRLGATERAVSSAGGSLGLGVRREIAGGASFGASVRFHELSNDELKRYVQATVDGSVRWGQ